MSLPPFATSAPLSLGVELELQIVNTQDYDLSPQAGDLLRVLAGKRLPGEIKPEITRSMIELSTGVCADVGQVQRELAQLRDALVDAGRQLEVALCGGGTHPFQHWSAQRIYDAPRFHELSGLYAYLSKQFTIFGQHVHIGCPDADTALRLLHGLSRYIPHVIALAASSPYVQGCDTGFHSARLNSVFAFPLSGRAPFVNSWPEFQAYFGKMARTGIVSGMKDFYWDIRPKPEYGTIEVRVLDTPLTIARATQLAAYLQSLARWLLLERPFVPTEDDYLVYAFNRFQACRFGPDATYVDPASGQSRSLRDAVLESLERIELHAMALGADQALMHLMHELRHGDGNDAGWLRRQHAQARQLPELVRQQTLRWMA